MKEVKPKFDVGHILKPVVAENSLIKLQVIEVITQKYYASTQIIYRCRIHSSRDASPDAQSAITKSLFDFSEMEVEKWTQATDLSDK